LHSIKQLLLVGATIVLGTALQAADAPATKLTIDLRSTSKQISPDLFGIFFEDLNYAADGGLYAELIQNRSFEYQATEQPDWNPLSFWELTQRGGGKGGWFVGAVDPVHANNPHYLILDIRNAGDGVGLINPGFDGIPVKAGEIYDFSVFARLLDEKRPPMPMIARLESRNGEVLGEASLQIAGLEWKRAAAEITAARSDDAARFVLLAKDGGRVALDELSLFPRHTFHDRPNGLRADLAQTIADLHPKFVRFPGGCLTHGDGVENIYRWKNSIGPIEQRKGQANIWRYHQSVGLGYFEYFQFCEDIGAKPLPVLAAGVSCQNSDRKRGTGQQCVPMEDMPAYIQDVLDLIEWANGPATSKWGAKRAEAGHPAPFHLEYLGIGNEDHITPGFKERFAMIYNAVKAKHPEITVVGTVGPSPDGFDFSEGWKVANESKVPIVDEHYYEPPQWFLSHFNRYDTYDRNHSKVYVGEYASRGNQLFNAIAEAAYMTQLERNGDIVHMASYAPLLAKVGHTQWNPDLIYFNNTKVAPTINYCVQKLFAENSGDTYYQTLLDNSGDHLAASTVRDSKSGDLILKVVNSDTTSKALSIHLNGGSKPGTATKTVLTGDLNAVNTFDTTNPVLPETSPITVGTSFDYQAPPNSLTVIRIKR